MTLERRREACAAQHFGYWAIEPQRMRALLSAYHNDELPKQDFSAEQPSADENGRELVDPADRFGMSYKVQRGVAVMDVFGQLTKHKSSYGGSSYIAIKHALRQARTKDGRVSAALLVIDSPGGTVDGIGELEEELRLCRDDNFPVLAFCDSVCASAAYWIASACETVYSAKHCWVGSIGVFEVLTDRSQRDADLGYKEVLVHTGGVKGLWATGEVTPELLEDEQRKINAIMDMFCVPLKDFRSIDRETIDGFGGRVYLAEEAQTLSLVDEILTIDEALEASITRADEARQKESIMNTAEFEAHAAAHPDDLKKASASLVAAAIASANADVDDKVKAAQEEATASATTAERARITELAGTFASNPEFLKKQIESGADANAAAAAAFHAGITVKREGTPGKIDQAAAAGVTGAVDTPSDSASDNPEDQMSEEDKMIASIEKQNLSDRYPKKK